MRKQIVYILCGLPFSGKTTLAISLAKKLNLAHINVDEFVRQKTKRDKVSENEWQRVFKECYEQLNDCLKKGESVVFDATNYAKSVRDKLRLIASENNAEAKVIFLDISEELARKRFMKNKDLNKRKDIPSSDFKEVVESLEKPTEEEEVILYSQESLESWIKQNIV